MEVRRDVTNNRNKIEDLGLGSKPLNAAASTGSDRLLGCVAVCDISVYVLIAAVCVKWSSCGMCTRGLFSLSANSGYHLCAHDIVYVMVS